MRVGKHQTQQAFSLFFFPLPSMQHTFNRRASTGRSLTQQLDGKCSLIIPLMHYSLEALPLIAPRGDCASAKINSE